MKGIQCYSFNEMKGPSKWSLPKLGCVFIQCQSNPRCGCGNSDAIYVTCKDICLTQHTALSSSFSLCQPLGTCTVETSFTEISRMKTLSLLKISQLNWWTLVLLPTCNLANCSTPSVGPLNTAHQKCCLANRMSPYEKSFCCKSHPQKTALCVQGWMEAGGGCLTTGNRSEI